MSKLTRSLTGPALLVWGFLSLLPFTIDDTAAARVRELGLGDMAKRSGRIFLGQCVARTVVEPEDGTRPYTAYTFDVLQAIKGVNQPTVTFSVSGSPDGPRFTGMPVFEVGQRALLLLYPPGRKGLTSPMGLGQGFFRLAQDAQGETLAVNVRDNRMLFRDVPEAFLERAWLDRRDAGPVRLESLEAVLRALVNEERP